MIQPIGNNILFKPFPGDEITQGGIIVPDNARGESDKGIIVRVGGGTHNRPMKLKSNTVGFRVHDWGEPIEENGERYYLMEDKAILALE
jgi:co-chaperonin GroES (HSP10)